MRSRRWVIAVFAVLALIAVGCGGDRGSDESGSGDDGGGGSTATTEAAVGPGDFGDLEGVCGPNEGGGDVPAGDPAETQGVTADSINLGTVSDPGFEGLPGLNQEIFDAGTAFVEWCNAAGGINGKQINLHLRDAAVTEYQPVLEQSCDEDFGIVGSGAVQDNLWPTVGAACGLIDIAGFSVTPEKGGLAGRDPVEARSIQPVPNPADRFQVGSYLLINQDFPDAGDNTSILYGDIDTTIVQKDKTKAAYEAIGYTVTDEVPYNILGEANWAPFAQQLADDNITFMNMVGSGDNLALLLQAMDEVGYRPDVIAMDANFYDQNWVDAAGPSADGVFVRTVFWPFEEADQNPATQQYIDMVNAVDGKVAQLGTQSMSAWLLFATAARDCDRDNNLTRTCVLENTAAVTEWTGGGLHAPASPGTNEPPECTILLQVQDGAFTRYAPDEGYDCGENSDEPYVIEIEPQGG